MVPAGNDVGLADLGRHVGVGLNVALPSIQRSLGSTNSELQWIIDAYGLIFAGLLLTAGAVGDRFGRRNALLGGLSVFALGAIVAGLGATSIQVIAGRIVMGVGAAFIMPATLSLVTSVFPPDERRRAIAVWAGFAGAGGAIGPIVSGALLETFWWGSALLVNVPIVAILMVVIAVYAPRSKDPDATPLDLPGAVSSLIGVSALVYGIIEGPNLGWTTATVIGAFALSAAAIIAFVVRERRTKYPTLPIELFTDLRFSVGSAVITTAFFAMFGFFFLNTLYLQFVRGYSPLLAGVAALPLAFSVVLVSPRSAALSERFGGGRVISAGFCFIAVGFVLLALVSPNWPYALLALAYVLLGVGMGITAAPATGNIMSAVPQAKAGVGSAVNDTTRELGGALGVAVLGSVVSSVYRSELVVSDLALPPGAADAAKDSVGAAGQIARSLSHGTGAELASRAGIAFTGAFNTASAISAVVAVVAAVVVAIVFRRSREQAADEADGAA